MLNSFLSEFWNQIGDGIKQDGGKTQKERGTTPDIWLHHAIGYLKPLKSCKCTLSVNGTKSDGLNCCQQLITDKQLCSILTKAIDGEVIKGQS